MPLVAKDADLTGYTVEYNDVVFSGGDLNGRGMMPPEIKLDGRAVYDAHDKQLIYTEYVLSVQTIIFSDNKEDMGGDNQSLREKLMQAGKTLKIKGTGFTDVNEIQDIANGPKPRSCSFKPLGGGISWLLNWTVTFSIKECYTPGTSTAIRFESLSYTVSHTLDKDGFAIRVISGNATVPIKATHSATDTADKLRDQLFFQLPVNFRRMSQKFDISADRKTITFAITDRQDTGTPLPTGCTHADGNFRMSASGFEPEGGGKGFASGVASMEMSFTVAPQHNRNIAAVWFWRTMLATQNQLISLLQNDEHEGVGKINAGTVMPSKIAMQYGMFDRYRDSSFAVEWMLVGPMLILLQSTEVWQAVPDTDYNWWVSSVTPQIRAQGLNDVRPDFSQDDVTAVIDVCEYTDTVRIGYDTNHEWNEGNYGTYWIACPQVDELRSWVVYNPEITVTRDNNVVLHRKAAGGYTGNETWETNTNLDPLDGTEPGPPENYGGSQLGDEDHEIEYRGRPRTRIAVQFVGVRLNYRPSWPVLKTVDGQQVKLSKTVGLKHKVIGNIAGCKLWAIRATHIYEAEKPLRKIKPHEQPVMGWADRATTGSTEDL